MEMLDEDRPPESIWLDDEALNDHFEMVRQKYKSGGSGAESVPQFEQNELTRSLRDG